MTGRPARIERAAFCDTLSLLGPDQPTLCSPWTTKDLAAHIVIRERRPDAAAGIVLPVLSGHTASVLAKTAAEKSFDELIELIRRPPWYSMAALETADNATNTTEFFVHTEDARRAQPDWSPRTLDASVTAMLIRQLRFVGKLRLRKYPASVTINITGYDAPIVAGSGAGPALVLAGDAGELTLFLNGRQRVSLARVTGPDDACAALRAADFRF